MKYVGKIYPEKKTDAFLYMKAAYHKAWNTYCNVVRDMREFQDSLMASCWVKDLNELLDDFWGSREQYYDVLHGHRGIGSVGIGVLPVRVAVIDGNFVTFYH